MKPDPKKSFPVIAVGASAGGFEAFKELVTALPGKFSGTLVFIQHLPVGHKSVMPRYFRQMRTDLNFVEVEDRMLVERGIIYLCPGGQGITIEHNRFRVHPPGPSHLQHSIDVLFMSVAQAFLNRAVGVILSGAGNDGTRGTTEIRSLGGTVLVQKPDSAQFASMPATALLGDVDMVLEVPEISRELATIAEKREESIKIDHLSTPEHLYAFFDLLAMKTGYRFHQYKPSVIKRRVRRRMQLKGFGDVEEYIGYMSDTPDETNKLAQDFMIGVTSFFRDPELWEVLKTRVLRPMVQESTDEPIRIWTPACSTGEESYSIAIMVFDEIARAGKHRDFQVFASDLNASAVESARRSEYAGCMETDFPPEYRRKYLVCNGDPQVATIPDEIREHLVFARHDLLSDPPFSKQDLVICRNFLIYLEPQAQKRCLESFHYALRENRYLFLGNAEGVGERNHLFKAIEPKNAHIFQRLPGKSHPSRYMQSGRIPKTTESAAALSSQAPLRSEIISEVRDTLLKEYGPAAVAVNNEFEILYNNGAVNWYLTPPEGEPTQHLLQMLPVRLRARLRTACAEAAEKAAPVSFRTTMNRSGGKKGVTIKVTPMRGRNAFFLIVFSDVKGRTRAAREPAHDEIPAEYQSAVYALETELEATRRDLQRHIEQLRGVNEEQQSSNEELQAANEELETSREELQSLNEELVTVNTQLQMKASEQEETNNDLLNFQASTNIPVLFLGPQLKIRRYTPAITNLIRLIPSDMGRQLDELSHENLGSGIIEDVRQVFQRLEPARKPVTVGDVSYIRTIQPYRSGDDRIDGVVITFTDVTELVRAEARIKATAEKLRIVADFTYDWEYWLGTDGRIVYMTPSCERVTGYTREEFMQDSGLYARITHPDDRDTMVDHLNRSLSESDPHEFEFRIVRRDGEIRWLGHLCQAVTGEDGELLGRRASNRDITKRKLAEESVRESQIQLTAILGHLPVGVGVLDASGKFVLSNETLRDFVPGNLIASMEEEEGERKRWYALDENGKPVEPQQWPGMRAIRGETVMPGMEFFHNDENGNRRWVSVSAVPFRLPGGATAGAIAVVQDITARKRSDEAVVLSERRLRIATGGAHLGVFEWHLPSDSARWENDQMFEIFGRSRNKGPVDKKEFMERFIHPDDREVFLGALAAGMQSDRQFQLECRIRRESDGQWRWIEYNGAFELADDGTPVRLTSIVGDITDRIQAAEILQNERHLLETIFESIPVMLTIYEPYLSMLHLNKAFYEITGWTEEDVHAKGVMDLVYPNPDYRREVAEFMESLQPGFKDIKMNCKDGSVRETSWANIELADGRRVGIGIDITERKAGERERGRLLGVAEEGKRILDALLEHVPEGIIVTEGVGTPVTVSRMLGEWTGGSIRSGIPFGSDEFVEAWGLCHPDTGVPITAEELPIMRVLNGGKLVVDDIWKQRSPDGKERLLSANAGPIHDRDKNLAGCVVAWRDITDIRRSQEALRKSEARFRTLADNISQLAWMLDETGRSFWYNKRFYDFTGTTLEEMQKEGWKRVLHPEEMEQVTAKLKGRLQSGEPWEDTFRMRGTDGGFRWFLSRALPIRNEQGQVVRWFGTNTDITQQRETEENLRRSTTELMATNRELEAFSYSASHDLRAPLRTVIGFSDMLEEDFPDKLGREGKLYLDRIRKAGSKMSSLIDDMLTLSRITRHQMEHDHVSLTALANGFVRELRKTNPDREIQISIHEGMTAVGDRGLLEAVVKNLIRNAWKYTGKTDHPNFEFGKMYQDGQPVFFAKDNGAGFNMEHADRLFAPFQRLHSDTDFPGTGIGLAIVQRIINRHGGRIWAEGKKGQGAVFYFTLGGAE